MRDYFVFWREARGGLFLLEVGFGKKKGIGGVSLVLVDLISSGGAGG